MKEWKHKKPYKGWTLMERLQRLVCDLIQWILGPGVVALGVFRYGRIRGWF